MRKILISVLLFFLLGCSDRHEGLRDGRDYISGNSTINSIYIKGREEVIRRSKIEPHSLDNEYYRNYIIIKDRICIVWFPIRLKNSLDNRNNYSACIDSNKDLSSDMEYSAHQ